MTVAALKSEVGQGGAAGVGRSLPAGHGVVGTRRRKKMELIGVGAKFERDAREGPFGIRAEGGSQSRGRGRRTTRPRGRGGGWWTQRPCVCEAVGRWAGEDAFVCGAEVNGVTRAGMKERCTGHRAGVRLQAIGEPKNREGPAVRASLRTSNIRKSSGGPTRLILFVMRNGGLRAKRS